MKPNRSFFLGLAGGALVTLGLVILIRSGHLASSGEILAEVGGEQLTREALRKSVTVNLVPIENDEYRVLEQGVNEWLNKRLLEKETKAGGISVEELYQKAVWSRVQVSYGEALEYYNKTRELYNEPFEKVSASISQELRRGKYARAKEEYLKELQKKYGAKVHLRKPASYVEGLAIPSGQLPSAETVPFPSPLPSAAPSVVIPAGAPPKTPPSRGPSGAPVTIMEFADFHCGFCKRVHPTIEKLLKNYPDKVRLLFRHYPLSTTPGSGSFLTHEASTCAQEQGKFWEFHDAIFSLAGAPQEADLQTLAKNVGLDAGKFQECLKTGRYQSFLQAERTEGSNKSVQGTPTFFINEQTVAGAYPYEHFVQVIESILNPGKVAPPAPPQAAPTPPAVVKFDDLEGRPSSGPKNASVTLVEFSDFQCPFCKRVSPTLEQLVKNYPGKIRRVWRHYPLSFHQDADRMAQASECAFEQGKFWEYHDKLFETQEGSHDEATLVRLAGDLSLDKKKFEKCLTGGKYKELVQKDQARGQQVGVSGTPAVFVNGKLVSGAQPYENFDQIVKAELSKS